jgi:DNA-binding NtrC family response regulator
MMAEAQKLDAQGPNLKERMEAYERELIESALIATAGNQRRAAARLGLLPTTLHEKMKRLGLRPRPDVRAAMQSRAS